MQAADVLRPYLLRPRAGQGIGSPQSSARYRPAQGQSRRPRSDPTGMSNPTSLSRAHPTPHGRSDPHQEQSPASMGAPFAGIPIDFSTCVAWSPSHAAVPGSTGRFPMLNSGLSLQSDATQATGTEAQLPDYGRLHMHSFGSLTPVTNSSQTLKQARPMIHGIASADVSGSFSQMLASGEHMGVGNSLEPPQMPMGEDFEGLGTSFGFQPAADIAPAWCAGQAPGLGLPELQIDPEDSELGAINDLEEDEGLRSILNDVECLPDLHMLQSMFVADLSASNTSSSVLPAVYHAPSLVAPAWMPATSPAPSHHAGQDSPHRGLSWTSAAPLHVPPQARHLQASSAPQVPGSPGSLLPDPHGASVWCESDLPAAWQVADSQSRSPSTESVSDRMPYAPPPMLSQLAAVGPRPAEFVPWSSIQTALPSVLSAHHSENGSAPLAFSTMQPSPSQDQMNPSARTWQQASHATWEPPPERFVPIGPASTYPRQQQPSFLQTRPTSSFVAAPPGIRPSKQLGASQLLPGDHLQASHSPPEQCGNPIPGQTITSGSPRLRLPETAAAEAAPRRSGEPKRGEAQGMTGHDRRTKQRAGHAFRARRERHAQDLPSEARAPASRMEHIAPARFHSGFAADVPSMPSMPSPQASFAQRMVTNSQSRPFRSSSQVAGMPISSAGQGHSSYCPDRSLAELPRKRRSAEMEESPQLDATLSTWQIDQVRAQRPGLSQL